MEAAPADLDVQAYCRSLALQQIQMLTRLAEIAMQLAEARAPGPSPRPRRPSRRPTRPRCEAARAEAQEAGLAFGRLSRTVQRALALRARAADSLCARDKAERKARRARQRDHVAEALFALIWDARVDPGSRRGRFRITEMREQLDELYATRTTGSRTGRSAR